MIDFETGRVTRVIIQKEALIFLSYLWALMLHTNGYSMMKKIFLFAFLITSLLGFSQSFYDFTVKDINGNSFALSQLKGKKVMVVNVASKCGFTPQYEQLEAIYEKYKATGFVIIGFPANDFKEQEPGTNKEIKQFCTENYGVTFPMMEKIHVKGDSIHPLYKWLTQKSLNGVEDSHVKWNFQKYLIGSTGKLEKVISPWTKPDSKKIINWVEGKK